MKGIRGLLEKDFRLFRYQGGKFFLVIAIVGLFLSLAGNMGTNFVSIYITSVMAIYSGSTISYVGAESIVGLFLKESEASLSIYSVRVLRIFILSFLLAGLNVVLGGYFTSVEKAGFATMISLTRSLIALVISLVFLTAVFGGEAIWWAPLIAESCCLVLSAGLYQWYRKK